MNTTTLLFVVTLLGLVVMAGCGPGSARAETAPNGAMHFTLQSAMADGRMVYVGVGGEIDGRVNPDLVVQPGATVYLTLLAGDAMAHDLAIPDLGVKTPLISGTGASATVTFEAPAGRTGRYSYLCTVSGHRQAGMEGALIVRPGGK
jgi:nitrite reductase (NO-forming)